MEQYLAMKKLIFAFLGLLCLASVPLLMIEPAIGQCNGIFPANTLCGNLGGSPAPPAAFSAAGTVVGPGTSTASDFSCWTNGSGTQIYDCGFGANRNMFLNVIAYGADPTGVADSTVPIAQALAVSTPLWGPVVYFPCGTYIANQISVFVQNKRLMGDTPGCSILKWKASSTVSDFIVLGNGTGDFSNLEMSNITVDGNGSNESNGNNNCIHIQNIHFPRLTNIEVQNCFKTGILVQDNAGRQNNSSGLLMINSHVTQWGVGGTGNGIDIENHMDGVQITNSVFDNGPSGTDEAHSAINLNNPINPVALTGNNIFTNAPEIFVSGGSLSATGNVLSYLGANSQCLVLTGSTHVHFVGNECVLSVGLNLTPISLNNSSKDNIFCGNLINTNGANAVTGFQEDSTSKPNYYCGATPAIGNLVSALSGGLSAYYTTNGPTVGAGSASILGCTAGACTVSTDYAGSLTTSTAITSATINFSTNWLNNTPACTISSNATSPIAAITAITSSTLTIGFGNATSSAVITYNCTGAK